jgi:hypothetical protein
MLIVATGSIVREPFPEQGGIVLSTLEKANEIRDTCNQT